MSSQTKVGPKTRLAQAGDRAASPSRHPSVTRFIARRVRFTTLLMLAFDDSRVHQTAAIAAPESMAEFQLNLQLLDISYRTLEQGVRGVAGRRGR